jgi:hypothetical protein
MLQAQRRRLQLQEGLIKLFVLLYLHRATLSPGNFSGLNETPLHPLSKAASPDTLFRTEHTRLGQHIQVEINHHATGKRTLS